MARGARLRSIAGTGCMLLQRAFIRDVFDEKRLNTLLVFEQNKQNNAFFVYTNSYCLKPSLVRINNRRKTERFFRKPEIKKALNASRYIGIYCKRYYDAKAGLKKGPVINIRLLPKAVTALKYQADWRMC